MLARKPPDFVSEPHSGTGHVLIHTMSHDGPLALLSFVVALFASYTALDMGSRLRRATGRTRTPWLIGSAVVLGSGIWSMHFLAMLAFRPGVPVAYDFHLTALSLIIAIAFAAIGFHLVARPQASFLRLAVAGFVVGMGVTAMHYSGMAALVLSGRLLFDPLLVGASFIVAVVAATAALWLTLNLTSPIQRVIAAIVMAVAVCGMHYTGMSATSLLCTQGAAAGTQDPNSRVLLAIAVAVAQFMVLCLAMVCVFADRRFELLAEREAERLRAANRALTASQSAIRNLLDHADQGFLTIGPDLAVEEQCSAACERMLETDPRGKPIPALLCRDGAVNAEDFATTLNSLLRDTNDYLRELKLGLLPELFTLGGKTIKVAYKYLADSQRLMLILTDITDTILLTAQVERESRRLQMTVLALTEGETFSSLVDDYEKFLTEELPVLLRLRTAPGLAGDLGRRLHTFKGLLSQFSFAESPAQLHHLETALGQDAALAPDAADALTQALKQDLDSVADVMGAGTGLGGRRVAISHHQVQDIRTAATAVMKSGEAPSPALQKLLQSVIGLGGQDVKSTIELHARGATTLAERLEKELAPIQVHGERISLSPERFGEFLRALVHVFRNSVDHGIEDPETRLETGKTMEGHIDCVVSNTDGMLEILIADDGRGIDRAALEAKLEDAGVPSEKCASLSLEDLVFCEGLSSRQDASEVSGRGIGLAAVKTELDRLGGTVLVESWAGKGTRFTFNIPVSDENRAVTKQMESICP